jgi:hypothetical protein
MGDAHTMDDTGVVRHIRERVGELTGDETALVRTLTPDDLTGPPMAEHLFDLVDLLTTIRQDEAMAEYVYAIAPGWDGTIETLLLGGRVTTAFTRIELQSCGALAVAAAPRATGRRTALRRVPATVA